MTQNEGIQTDAIEDENTPLGTDSKSYQSSMSNRTIVVLLKKALLHCIVK